MSRRGPDPRISWIAEFMQRHLSEPLSIALLAERLALSRSRFLALFTAQMGVPPMRYLQRTRLLRARLLIERTFLTLDEIMALVGYHDPSHFVRDFRGEHGVQPSALRTEELATPVRASTSDDRPSDKRLRSSSARDPRYVYT